MREKKFRKEGKIILPLAEKNKTISQAKSKRPEKYLQKSYEKVRNISIAFLYKEYVNNNLKYKWKGKTEPFPKNVFKERKLCLQITDFF